ncbi:hypothetical protein [Herbiconiux daphne]|uniref:Uncharacterized protein n=1 Tax=Herbiconiux daphne TaxID=2970914 RepID=A0ABT2H1K4_9MICO|nr:hypothetical protein [Herbiconiux daphne]MCS5733794.1 hypothetical protein [Herbiconiux daphne]
MDAVTIINLALLLVTAIGVAVAIYQAKEARAARNEAQDAQDASERARDQTVRLAEEANSAFVRSAAAQEEANEIAKAAIPKPAVTWMIRPIRRSRFEVTNVGSAVAFGAVVAGAGESPGHVHPDSEEAQDVLPNDGLGVAMLVGYGSDPVVRISWRNTPAGQLQTVERTYRG